jgi:hypothetical protein
VERAQMGSIVPVLPTGAAGLEDQQSSAEEDATT